MAISLKHAFTSAKSDGGDATLVQPSNWNEEHDLTLAADKLLGRDSSGAGAVQEIACTAAGRALLDDAAASDQRTTLGLGSLATLSTISTANITDDQVTYAKIQNVSASPRLLGRTTAGAGDIEEISAGAGVTLSGGTISVTATATVKLSTQTAAGSSSLDFTSGIDSTYRAYVFELDNLLPATDAAELHVQVSTDGGSSWKSTTYKSTVLTVDGTATSTGGFTTAHRITTGSIENTAGYGVSGQVVLTTPSNSSTRKLIRSECGWFGSDGNVRWGSSAGFWNGGNDVVNAIRFIMDSGSITSGSITLYGKT